MNAAASAVRVQLLAEKAMLKYAYGNDALDPWLTDSLAELIAKNGCSDIRNIEAVTVQFPFVIDVDEAGENVLDLVPVTLYFDRETGAFFEGIGGIDATSQDYHDTDVFASTSSRDYWAYYLIRMSPDGVPFFVVKLESRQSRRGFLKNLLATVAPIVGIAISFFVPGLGAAIGSAVLGSSTAAAYPLLAAGIGNTAISAALNGGDIERAVIGSVGGALGSVAGGAAAAATDSALLASATAAATSAAVTGGDLKMAVSNALIGTGARNMGEYLQAGSSAIIDVGEKIMDFGDLFQTPDPVFPVADNYAFSPDLMPLDNVDGFELPVYGDGFAPAGQPVYDADILTFDSGDAWGGEAHWPTDPGLSDLPSTGWGGEAHWPDGGGGIWGTVPPAQAPVFPPPTPSDGGGFWGQADDAINALSALAVAAIKVNQAYQMANNPTAQRAGSVLPNGSTQTPNRNGTVTLRTPNGASSTVQAQVGVPYILGDGSTMINNGNGTYSIVNPVGQTVTGSYSQSTTAGASMFAGIDQKTLLIGGAALAAMLMLR